MSDLYIFADGPKPNASEETKHLISEVRQYIHTIGGFRSIHIEESPENKGLANSVIYGVTKVIRQHGLAIVLEDDDGEKYQSFIQTATPLFLPTCRINTLISCRLEKYRFLTENWLAQNNISYNQLVMLDFPDKTTRMAWNKHGNYKGEYYKQRSDCTIFIESSLYQANIIAEISNKPVYCVETNTMIQIPIPISIRKPILHSIRDKFPQGYYWLQSKYYKMAGNKKNVTQPKGK